MKIQHKRISRTKVSHHHSHQSIKRKRSNSLIHVTVGSSKATQSITNHHQPTNKNLSHTCTKNIVSQKINCRKLINLSRSSKISHYQTRTESLDKNGTTNDYHKIPERNKKIKCSHRFIIGCVIVNAIIILSITAFLLALFIKSRKIISPSVNMPVLRWNTSGITIAGNGSSGNANNRFNNPRDIILDHANNFYIADAFNHRIQKFLSGSLNGTTIIGNGTVGSSQNQLNSPSRIIFDSNENMYIADLYNHRIQFWHKNNLSISTIAGITGSPGNSSYQLNIPHGIALNEMNGTLYVSDYANHRIMSFVIGTNNGTIVIGGTGSGVSDTQLCNPVGLQFDIISNSLIIANYLAHNVVRYVLDATHWTLLAGNINGFQGLTSTHFNRPIETILDPMGNMYVADRNNHRIQLFYIDQFNGSTIVGTTSVSGSNASLLHTPWSVKLDNQLNLYVVDTANHRVQKFLRY